MGGCRGDHQGGEAKQREHISVFLEFNSWSREGLRVVLESKELAHMQSPGVSEFKDRTLQLQMQLDEVIRSRDLCPFEERISSVDPGLEQLAELFRQPLPVAAPLGDVRGPLWRGTVMPPELELDCNGCGHGDHLDVH
jgi:hypothetical protein